MFAENGQLGRFDCSFHALQTTHNSIQNHKLVLPCDACRMKTTRLGWWIIRKAAHQDCGSKRSQELSREMPPSITGPNEPQQTWRSIRFGKSHTNGTMCGGLLLCSLRMIGPQYCWKPLSSTRFRLKLQSATQDGPKWDLLVGPEPYFCRILILRGLGGCSSARTTQR